MNILLFQRDPNYQKFPNTQLFHSKALRFRD